MRPASLNTAHGNLPLPAFLPDGTRGVVRALDAADLARVGIQALMVNALHLSTSPGTTVVSQLGGIHRFTGWEGPIASDSGGFQVLSLAAGGAKGVSITRKGFAYRLEGHKKKRTLTPDKCIRSQIQLGSDIVFCLDHCTHPDAPEDNQRESVENTIAWAKGCRESFDRAVEKMKTRPLLYAVIQGGRDRDLRTRCAEALTEIGFDGYGFGGWPIDEAGGIEDAVGIVAELAPKEAPLHALGIGKPRNVAAARALGYDTFDCSIPTRDARQGRLYVAKSDRPGDSGYCYIKDERFSRQSGPIDETCDCPVCAHYDAAYLHHLFTVGETGAARLATMHNLRYYARLMDSLRKTAPGQSGVDHGAETGAGAEDGAR